MPWGRNMKGQPQKLCKGRFLSPAPSWLTVAAKSTGSFGQRSLPSQNSSVSTELTEQPLPKSQAHFHTRSTTAASPKRPKRYFSNYNQPAKGVQNSTASRTEKTKQVLSTAVGVSLSIASWRTVNHSNLPANVSCLILRVICGSEMVSSGTCCRGRGRAELSQRDRAGQGTQHQRPSHLAAIGHCHRSTDIPGPSQSWNPAWSQVCAQGGAAGAPCTPLLSRGVTLSVHKHAHQCPVTALNTGNLASPVGRNTSSSSWLRC